MVQLFVPGKKEDLKDKAKFFESKLIQFKNKIVDENIKDDSLNMFVYQLEKELEKLKAGDNNAAKRASLLIDSIEQRLSDLHSEDALAELRTKIKKPIIEGGPESEEMQAIPTEEPEAPEQPAEVEEAKEGVPEQELKKFIPVIEERQTIAMPKIEETKAKPEIPAQETFEMEAQPNEQPEKEFSEEQPVEKETQEEEPYEEEPRYIAPEEKEIRGKEKPSITIVSFDKAKAEKLAKNSVDIILKAQLDNGAIPMMPIASLHYIYPRAHLLATLGLIYAGKFENAKKALEFSLKGQNRHTGALPQRWDYNGNDASYRKVEPDCTALFLYAFAEYVQKSADYEFAEHHWEKIEKAVDFINSKIVPGKNLVLTPNSIHEYAPMDYGYEIWCNAVCCAALRELGNIAERVRLQYPALDKENLLKEAIMSYMWNTRLNTFIKTIKVEDTTSVIPGPDASVLSLSFFNVFGSNDERLKSTVDFTEKGLKYKPLGGIMDYPPSYGQESSGIGANILFTLLLADYYVLQDNHEKAKEYLQWVLSVATEGKLPKYIATKDDFEALVSDLNDAGLIDREVLTTIENTRKHPDYSNNIAHIMEPYLPSHGIFLVVWARFKAKFKEE